MSQAPSLCLQSAANTLFFHHNSLSKNRIPFSIKNNSFSLAPKLISRNKKNVKGGSLVVVAYSTSSSFIGRVGLHKREGNFTMLSFGVDPKFVVETEVKSDTSQLSALISEIHEPQLLILTPLYFFLHLEDGFVCVNGDDVIVLVSALITIIGF